MKTCGTCHASMGPYERFCQTCIRRSGQTPIDVDGKPDPMDEWIATSQHVAREHFTDSIVVLFSLMVTSWVIKQGAPYPDHIIAGLQQRIDWLIARYKQSPQETR